MEITALLQKDTIILDLQSRSKDEVLSELINSLDRANKLHDREQFKLDILKRETQSSTGVGDAIAIPHAKSTAVKEPAIVFGRSKHVFY
ncbi:MAG TPA: PTS sugar transporter subunit IIA [Pseudogracilibacillus sp.]|nr:PTS sugar transporter subunit IIA [Pseudogracilibacillus sp.]